MHRRLFALYMLVVSFGLFGARTVAAGGADDVTSEIPLAQVPKAVLETVKKKFPDAQLQSASRGMDEGQPFYDVFIKVKTQNVWVTCDARGAILVVDREIKLQDLPKPVAEALAKKYPKATVRLVNEITEDSLASYDIALTFNRKKLIAIFEANGRFVEDMPDDEP